MACPEAPSHGSALMAGVGIKMDVYGLLRVSRDLVGGGPAWGGGLGLGVGAVSALLGVLYALMEHDLKRLLAYHSIENIGIILMGLRAALMFLHTGHPVLATLALIAGLYHTINHATFKSLLFLVADAVLPGNRTRLFDSVRHGCDHSGLCSAGILPNAVCPIARPADAQTHRPAAERTTQSRRRPGAGFANRKVCHRLYHRHRADVRLPAADSVRVMA